jgi:anaerobic ribonucleoside-triphosphate reductase activating protein
MNYCGIKKTDIANGPGVRVSLFVSGCRNHCPGCFQPETWDFDYGEPFTKETEDETIKALRPSWIQGLSILAVTRWSRKTRERSFRFSAG